MRTLRRTWPLLLIVALLTAAYASGLSRELSWPAIAAHEAGLRQAVAEQPAISAAAYVAIYAAVVAASIPGGVWLTLGGGLLFGAATGTALAVIGATTGAVLLFLVMRTALAPILARRAGPFLNRVRPGLERDGFSYLLSLRLIPVVPFWLTNLAPALVGMRLPPYAAATFIGIIPATAVFASVGAGLGRVLAAGEPPNPVALLLSPSVLLPLLALALLSLAPIAWRRWRLRDA